MQTPVIRHFQKDPSSMRRACSRNEESKMKSNGKRINHTINTQKHKYQTEKKHIKKQKQLNFSKINCQRRSKDKKIYSTCYSFCDLSNYFNIHHIYVFVQFFFTICFFLKKIFARSAIRVFLFLLIYLLIYQLIHLFRNSIYIFVCLCLCFVIRQLS